MHSPVAGDNGAQLKRDSNNTASVEVLRICSRPKNCSECAESEQYKTEVRQSMRVHALLYNVAGLLLLPSPESGLKQNS